MILLLRIRHLALLAVMLLTLPAIAAGQPVIPDDKFVYCTVCHGVQVGGNRIIAAPRLSDLSAWYVERQLQGFKKGWRGVHDDDAGGHEMRPMAAILTDAEIAEAAQYVDAVDSPLPEATVEGDPERGKSLYGSCIACHGANGEGNETLFSPALAGLNDWYVVSQLSKFKAGIRGNHADDTYGQQMRAAAGLLPDEQAIRDVARYISTLSNQ